MIIGIIGAVIGIILFGTGIYYFNQEKNDMESRKIYGVVSAIGAAVFVVALIVLIAVIR